MSGKGKPVSAVPDVLSDKWITITDAAQQLRRHRVHVSRLISQGKLATMRYGRFRFVSVESVLEYIRSHERSAAQ